MLDKHMLGEHIGLVTLVVGTDEFTEWYGSLDDPDTDAVTRVVDMLEVQGPTLPFPYSSAIKGSRVALRELRIQSKGKPLRVFYVFDPARQAVLLIGGDKTGDANFYDRSIRQAELIWARYLKETGQSA